MDKYLSTAQETALLLFDGMPKAEIEVHLAIANYLIPGSPEPLPRGKRSTHWSADFRVATRTKSCSLTC